MISQDSKLPDDSGKPSRGLDPAEIKTGRMVTISVNKATGDRSLCQVIWEIVSINDGHALVKCRHLRHLLYGTPETRLISLQEHEFYSADDLVLALAPDRGTVN